MSYILFIYELMASANGDSVFSNMKNNINRNGNRSCGMTALQQCHHHDLALALC